MLRLCVTNLPLMSLASEFLFFFVAGVSMQRNLHEGFATDALELKSKAPSCDIRYAKHSWHLLIQKNTICLKSAKGRQCACTSGNSCLRLHSSVTSRIEFSWFWRAFLGPRQTMNPSIGHLNFTYRAFSCMRIIVSEWNTKIILGVAPARRAFLILSSPIFLGSSQAIIAYVVATGTLFELHTVVVLQALFRIIFDYAGWTYWYASTVWQENSYDRATCCVPQMALALCLCQFAQEEAFFGWEFGDTCHLSQLSFWHCTRASTLETERFRHTKYIKDHKKVLGFQI